MKKNKAIYLLLMLICAIPVTNSQDLIDLLDKEVPDDPQYTLATFKASRITFGQSVETRKARILEINVITKFWNTPNSQSQSFGADRVSARFGLEYAFTDRFTAGVGVATFDGTFNGFGKYRIIRQKEGNKGTPFGITFVQSASYLTRSFNRLVLPENSSERFSFASQLLIARKFTPNFSLQLAPTYVHRRSQQFPEDDNDHFALGIGARYKLGGHVSIASEYYYVANPINGVNTFGPFALGVNWEVSDLILQFTLTNTLSFDEATVISFSPKNFNFNNGNLHIGVSATYVLHFNKKNK